MCQYGVHVLSSYVSVLAPEHPALTCGGTPCVPVWRACACFSCLSIRPRAPSPLIRGAAAWFLASYSSACFLCLSIRPRAPSPWLSHQQYVSDLDSPWLPLQAYASDRSEVLAQGAPARVSVWCSCACFVCLLRVHPRPSSPLTRRHSMCVSSAWMSLLLMSRYTPQSTQPLVFTPSVCVRS